MKKILSNLSLLIALFFLSIILLCIYFLPELTQLTFDELVEAIITDREFQVSIASWIAILMIIFSVIRIFWVFIFNCVNNLKDTGDDLFRDLDSWHKTKCNNQFYYNMGIQLINDLYCENGEIRLLIGHREGSRLQKRKKYLESQLELWDEFHRCVLAIMQSVIAAWMVEFLPNDNWLISFIWIAVIVLSILAMPVAKYSGKLPLLNIYEKAIWEYELQCLNECIKEYHKSLTVSKSKKIELYTQQIVVLELSRLLKDAKKQDREKIEKDINLIEGLNLVDYDESNNYHVLIYIGKNKCCLVYKKTEGIVNNYIGPLNLINEDYTKLYNVLHEYRMFTYSNDCQEIKSLT